MKLSYLFGIHAVEAALNYSAEHIQQVWLDNQRQDTRLKPLIAKLQSLGLAIQSVERKKLDKLSTGKNHQGIIVSVMLPEMRNEAELQTAVGTVSKLPLFLVLDQIQDPHNLGACLRSADATGVHGIIIPKDNAVGITPTVCKVASGAAETVPVYQVTNLARTLRWLKTQGLWIIGAAGRAEQNVYTTDFNLPLAIVIGTEATGLRRLTQEHCDILVKLPMRGTVESLNLSVATGVLLYEVLRQRSLTC